ncbi:MAG: FAD:protein transferase [Acidobacteriota bacterium]|jgi:thiamine biosynthesis lipoprotein
MHWLLRVSASVLALAVLPEPELKRFEAVEPHMGTLVRITVFARSEQAANDAFRAAFDRIAHLDRTLSDYQADSELNEVARTAVQRVTPVSDDLFAVLRASQDLAGATGGAFDITLGPVIRLWREARKTGRVPDPTALKDAASRTGFRKLHLDVNRRTVSFDMPGMALDVGAIAKGFAASEAIAVLSRLGVRSALVAVSGDLAFSDPPPGHRGWQIGVRSDDAADPEVPRVLELSHAAVSTAGSSEQHLDAGGRRYSHIIDPATGMGLMDDITVTVIARNGIDADGLDTAVSVIGADRGLALIEDRPETAALITRRAGTATTFLQSSRFRTLAAQYGVAR